MLKVFVFLTSLTATFAGYSGNTDNSVAGYAGYPNLQGFPFVPVPRFDFNFLGEYFNNLQKYHQQLAANIQQQVQQINRYGYPGSYLYGDFGNGVNSGSYGGRTTYGTGNGFAIASGGIGPNGGFQTAAVYPENPGVPNVNTRFSGMGFPPGTYGVFTSSQSTSGDINGQKYHYDKASTTINDNGKISTFTVHNP